jgi:hypothetical protein
MAGASWEALIPLGEPPEAQPFPLEVLPPSARKLVVETARALPCPPDYVAVPLLVMAGAAIGRSRVLRVKGGHLQPPLLYAAVIGSPGSMKSPALEVAAAEVFDVEEVNHREYEKEREEYDAAVETYKEDMTAYRDDRKTKKDRAGLKKPQKPTRPVHKRVLVDNATAESLVPILTENPRGLVRVQDELTAWVQGMNQYKEGGKGSDRQFWLSNWSCANVLVDRKKDHEKGPLLARNPFVAVVGGLPPDRLRLLRSDRPGRPDNDGFMDRILPSYPAELPATGENWEEIDPATVARFKTLMGALRRLDMMTVKEGEEVKGYRPFVVHLDRSGREAWSEFTNAHAAQCNDEGFPQQQLRGPWSKMKGYCARLALILHYLWLNDGALEGGNQSDVGGESVRRAALLVDYFKSHSRKVYALIDADPVAREARRVVRWLQREFSESLNSLKAPQVVEIKRSGLHAGVWGGSRSVAEMERVLDLLVKHNYLRPKDMVPGRSGPGRLPSQTYEVNPAVFTPPSTPSEPFREFRDSENSPEEEELTEPSWELPQESDREPGGEG